MAKYVITGGSGFIGSSLAEELVKAGERVAIIDDFSTGRAQNLENIRGQIDLYKGSILDADLLSKVMTGCEVVFHLAAIPSVSRSIEEPCGSMMVNVLGTTKVLDVAKNEKVRRIIFAASSSAYGNTKISPKNESMSPEPLSPYAVSKSASESLMKVFSNIYGIETLSLRYFNVFGPKQDPDSDYAAVIPKFMTAAIRKEPCHIFGDGLQTRDFCYVKNTVSANLLAANSQKKLSGEVLNVACGKSVSLKQLWTYICEEAGAFFEPIYQKERAGDVRNSLADISAIRELLGYEPRVDLRRGLKLTFEAFKSATRSQLNLR